MNAEILKNYFIRRLSESEKVEIKYGIYIENVSKLENHYQLELNDGNVLETDFVLNATYVHQLIKLVDCLDLKISKLSMNYVKSSCAKLMKNLKILVLQLWMAHFFRLCHLGKQAIIL